VIAYYWSKFKIPATDLELVPEFSEERVLDALEGGFKERRGMTSPSDIQISEVTASRRYHHDQVGGVTLRENKTGTTAFLL